jgi:hypothetical protein
MQGSMKSQLRIIRTEALALGALLALAAAMPAAAQAGPLLSGYGGPGQGSQVILGSTLLGGPGGSGSSGAGGGSSSSEAAGAPSAVVGAAPGRHARGGPTIGNASGAAKAQSGALAGAYPASEVTAGTGSGLGLSGADIAYIAVAAAALVLTGALTKAMAGTRTAKGH